MRAAASNAGDGMWAMPKAAVHKARVAHLYRTVRRPTKTPSVRQSSKANISTRRTHWGAANAIVGYKWNAMLKLSRGTNQVSAWCYVVVNPQLGMVVTPGKL
jgi:hypothetical protein